MTRIHRLGHRGGIRGALVVACCSLALVACTTRSSSSNGSATKTGAAPGQSGSAAAGAPTNGGSITYAVALDVNLGGIFQTLQRNYPWLEDVFEPVAKTDPVTRKLIPVLATSVAVAPDGLSADIKLRSDVTFQTGRKMTADDVKYTFEQAALPANGSNLAFVAKAFKSIDVVSPTELKITFSSPQPSFNDFLDQTVIVDQQTFSGLKSGSKVVGTGPYEFTDWKPGASYTLKKYPGYWDAKDIHLDAINYVVISDATAELNALRSGRAQMAWGLTATDAQSVTAGGQYGVLDAGGTLFTLGLNTATAPFNNPTVRQAVAYALDRKRINQQVFAGSGWASDVWWGQKTPGMDSSLATQYSYDLSKAKQLIQQAGASGASVPITYGANPDVRAMYSIVANNLTAIGLKPTSVALDQASFSAKQSKGDLGPAYLSLHGQVGLSPATMLEATPPLRKGNPSQFWTPQYVSLRNSYLAASSSTQATSLNALTKYMLDQAFNLPLVQAPTQMVLSNKIHGAQATIRGFVLFNGAYLGK